MNHSIWRFTLRFQALNLFLEKTSALWLSKWLKNRPWRSSSCAHLPSSRTFSQCSLPGGIWGAPGALDTPASGGESGGRNFLGKVMFLPIFELFSPKTMFFLFCLALKWCVFWVTLTVQFVEMTWNDIIQPEGRKLLWRPLAAQSCTTSCGHDQWFGTQFPVPAPSTNRIQ